MKVLVIDCETTGGDPFEVIELAYSTIYVPEWQDEFAVSSERFKPRGKITFGAMAVHHIMPEFLDGLPPSSECRLPGECQYVIGHNVDYDWQALGSPDVKRICTLALAREAFPKMDSHSLVALSYMIHGMSIRETAMGAHCASTDVVLTIRLVGELQHRLGLDGCSVEELWQASEAARVPKVMPFGKHKGVPIGSVPSDYKRWLLGQSDVDPYLARALQQ